MKVSLILPHSKSQIRTIICVLISVFLAWSANIEPAYSQPQPGREDFGAETIDDSSAKPLPVDMVEERDATAQQRTAESGGSNSKSSSSEKVGKSNLLLAKQIGAALEENQFGATLETSANGIAITSLDEKSVLERLGLKQGDLVNSFNGQAISQANQMGEILGAVLESKPATVVVNRGGEEIILPLLLKTASSKTSSDNQDEETTTVLNGNDIEIAALIKTFSKLTKRNFILDSSVKGKVTIHLPSAVKVSEALRILDTILLLKGFTSVPVAENTWKVVSAKDARQTTIPLVKNSSKDTASDVMVTQLIRLKHISAEDSQQLLNQFVSRDGVINAFTGTNSLVLIDSEANTNRLRELIAEIDVPAVDQEMTIIPILHAEASDISEKVNNILGEEENNAQAQALNTRGGIQRRLSNNNIARSTRGQQNSAPSSASGSTVRRRSLPFKIIPDERTNSIIVVADEEMTLKVRALVDQLDSELDRSGGKFYVYRLQHADAEELAEILNNVVSGSNESNASSSTGTRGSSLSANRNTRANPNTARQARLTQALQRSRELLRSRSAAQNASEGKVNLEGEVSIAPDPATNSLIINASRSDYQKIKEVIDELDLKRRQVLVEATILEVSLDHQEGMGVELQGTAGLSDGGLIGQTNFGGLTNLLTNPAALTDLTIAAASTGSLTLPGGITIPSQAVLLSAVSRLTNVNVLSSPNIMATDNEEAEIIVGENVPFVTSTSTDTTNISNTFNSIERQDVGITLRITPQISTGDFVDLNIFVEISNVVAGTRNDPNGPTTTIRTTETTVNVKDGQMVVTGGLLQDSVTDSTRGVPFLKDIPVLGQYFQTQDETIKKTNLLVFITPKIIADQFDARESTKDKAVPLAEHIDEFQLFPSRDEVLNSDALDRVTEELPLSPDAHPTTITPPDYSSRNQPSASSEFSYSPGTDDVIDLKVVPKLPSDWGSTPRQEQMRTIEPSPAKQATLSNQQSSQVINHSDSQVSKARTAATKTYVVLRQISEPEPELPFPYADEQKTVGLIVLGSFNSPATQFFRVGNTYGYGLDQSDSNNSSSEGNNAAFVCLGRYPSLAEAAKLHSSLNNQSVWYSLSAQETLTLGKQGWKQN